MPKLGRIQLGPTRPQNRRNLKLGSLLYASSGRRSVVQGGRGGALKSLSNLSKRTRCKAEAIGPSRDSQCLYSQSSPPKLFSQ